MSYILYHNFSRYVKYVAQSGGVLVSHEHYGRNVHSLRPVVRVTPAHIYGGVEQPPPQKRLRGP